MLGNPCLKERGEVGVDEIKDKLPEVFEGDCHLYYRKLKSMDFYSNPYPSSNYHGSTEMTSLFESEL